MNVKPVDAMETAKNFALRISSGDLPDVYYAIGAHQAMSENPSTQKYADSLLDDYFSSRALAGIDSGLSKTFSNLVDYSTSLENSIVSYSGLDEGQVSRLREDRLVGDSAPMERVTQKFYFG